MLPSIRIEAMLPDLRPLKVFFFLHYFELITEDDVLWLIFASWCQKGMYLTIDVSTVLPMPRNVLVRLWINGSVVFSTLIISNFRIKCSSQFSFGILEFFEKKKFWWKKCTAMLPNLRRDEFKYSMKCWFFLNGTRFYNSKEILLKILFFAVLPLIKMYCLAISSYLTWIFFESTIIIVFNIEHKFIQLSSDTNHAVLPNPISKNANIRETNCTSSNNWKF